MGAVYSRCPHTAFVMGFESEDATDDASYVANLLTSNIAVLNGPSAVIWEILEKPTTSEDIILEITEIYGVSKETVAASVLDFLYDLKAQGLVEVSENSILEEI